MNKNTAAKATKLVIREEFNSAKSSLAEVILGLLLNEKLKGVIA
ncbi:MAG TPA: hypothetical protein VHS59_05755 [Bacillota bacterium]|nr:hypothetical protein [Bacillota bacterium]